MRPRHDGLSLAILFTVCIMIIFTVWAMCHG